MSNKIDIEAALRASLTEHARHAPAAGVLAERIIAEVDLLPPAHQPRRSRQWRTWTLPLVAAGSVAAVAAALVGVSQSHHSATPQPPAVSHPVPSPRPVASTGTPRPNPKSSAPASTHVAGPPDGPVPSAFAPESATFVSTRDGWVLGRAGCLSGGGLCTALLRTTDGGASWAAIPAPRATVPATLYDVSTTSVENVRFADTLDGWAFRGALYSTHDGGRTWLAEHLGGAAAGVDSLETAAGSVWALVDNCFVGTSCRHSLSLYQSPIGASAWRMILGPLDNQVGDGYQPGQLYVHGGDWWVSAGNALYHGFAAQAPARLAVSCPAGAGVAAIAVADRDHLDALCEGQRAAGSAQLQLLGTVDGGRHWASAGPAFRGPGGVSGIADNASGVLLLASSSGGSVVSRTADDGASFTSVLDPSNTGGLPWNDLGFTDATQAFVVLAGKAFYLSHDAGLTWTPLAFH